MAVAFDESSSSELVEAAEVDVLVAVADAALAPVVLAVPAPVVDAGALEAVEV